MPRDDKEYGSKAMMRAFALAHAFDDEDLWARIAQAFEASLRDHRSQHR